MFDGDVTFGHSKMESLQEHLTFGHVFLAIVFLLILNQLIELYQFRNMPPGPRLTSLPVIGNLLSFDSGDGFREITTRFVYLCRIAPTSFLSSLIS